MRAFWTGTLMLAEIAIPVGIAAAHQPDRVDLTVLHDACGAKIERRACCPVCDPGDQPGVDRRLLPDDELVRAFELTRGQYLPVTDQELATADPPDTRTIEITHVVPASALGDLAVDTSYLLTPSEAPMGRRPYELLRRTLADQDEIAVICRAVVRKHEWVCRLRAHHDHRALVLEKLHPAGTLAKVDVLEQQLAGIELTEQELHLARELINGRLRVKTPAGMLAVHTTQRRRQLIDAKLAGTTIVIEPQHQAEQQPLQLPTANLEAALTRSIRNARRRTSAKPKPRPARAAAKR